jgi:tRNA:m4X modification enzyme
MAPPPPPATLKAGKPDTNTDTDIAPVYPPPVPDGWERCHAYMDRKKRFCRQELVPIVDESKSAGPRYCGNHQHLVSCDSTITTSTTSNDSKKRKRTRVRIPCPMDPSHSIFEDAVKKHIPICPLTVKQKKQTEQAFYQHNINIGGYGSSCGSNSAAAAGQQSLTSSEQQPSRAPTERLEWAKRVALTVLHVHQNILSISTTTTITATASTATPTSTALTPTSTALTELTGDSIHQQIPVQDLSAPEFEAGLRKSVASYRIKSGGQRHLHQQASLT